MVHVEVDMVPVPNEEVYKTSIEQAPYAEETSIESDPSVIKEPKYRRHTEEIVISQEHEEVPVGTLRDENFGLNSIPNVNHFDASINKDSILTEKLTDGATKTLEATHKMNTVEDINSQVTEITLKEEASKSAIYQSSRLRSASIIKIKKLKTMACKSSKKVRSFVKSLATALASVRARTQSRVRVTAKEANLQSEFDAKSEIVEGVISFDKTGIVDDLKEASVQALSDDVEEVNGKSSDHDVKERNVERTRDELRKDPDPAPRTKETETFLFSRFSEKFFCNTVDYWGDLSTICGGSVPPALEVVTAPNDSRATYADPQAETPVSPSTINAVEVTPIFDETESAPPSTENSKSIHETEQPNDTVSR